MSIQSNEIRDWLDSLEGIIVKPIKTKEDYNDLKGSQYWNAIFDFDQYLRSRTKHEELSDDVYNALDEARSRLREALENYGVSLDDYS